MCSGTVDILSVAALQIRFAMLCISCRLFCPAIMKFMGDAPLKGQTEQDLVTTILKVEAHSHTHIVDNRDWLRECM